MERAFFTIGYEGASLAEFIEALNRAGVRALLDIRLIPWSRKPGFVQATMARALEDNGIAYRHFEALGNPQKRVARAAEDPRDYQDMYNAHLATQAAQIALKDVAQITRTQKACLLCFERDPNQCHRLLTAQALSALTGQQATHLFTEKEAPLFKALS